MVIFLSLIQPLHLWPSVSLAKNSLNSFEDVLKYLLKQSTESEHFQVGVWSMWMVYM